MPPFSAALGLNRSQLPALHLPRVERCIARLVVALSSVVAGLQIVPTSAERRVALVIGNASYAHQVGLPNVPNDAAAMAALLRAAKFDAVDVRQNLGVADLRRALRQFAGRAADADVAVLFYAIAVKRSAATPVSSQIVGRERLARSGGQ